MEFNSKITIRRSTVILINISDSRSCLMVMCSNEPFRCTFLRAPRLPLFIYSLGYPAFPRMPFHNPQRSSVKVLIACTFKLYCKIQHFGASKMGQQDRIVNHTSYHHANKYESCVASWCIIFVIVGGEIGLCASSVMNFY